jgi:O-antigen ligase
MKDIKSPDSIIRPFPMPANKRIKLIFFFTLLLLPAILSQIGGFNPSQQDISTIYEQGSIISRIYFPLILIWTLYVFKTKTKSLLWTRYELLLITYLLLGVFYSSTPNIVLRGVFTAITLLLMWNTIAILIVNEYSLDFVIETLILFIVVYGMIECIFWYTDVSRMNRYGEMGQYIGYFQHSNLFAKIISIGIILNIFCLLTEKRKELKYWFSCIILLIFLLGSGSRTSLIAVIAAVIVTFLFIGQPKFKYVLSLVIISIVGYILFISFYADFFTKVDIYSPSNVLEAGTFISRIHMWDLLLPEMLEHFWFGVGLNSFWTPSILYGYGLNVAGIHNGYLQVFEDLGIIGLILTVAIHLPLLKTISNSKVGYTFQCFRRFLIASWIYFAIVNITEGDWGNYRSSLWGMLIVLSIFYSLHLQSTKKETASENILYK